MPLLQLTCPHCERGVEVRVASKARAGVCPDCSKKIVLWVKLGGKKKTRKAQLLLPLKATALSAENGAPQEAGLVADQLELPRVSETENVVTVSAEIPSRDEPGLKKDEPHAERPVAAALSASDVLKAETVTVSDTAEPVMVGDERVAVETDEAQPDGVERQPDAGAGVERTEGAEPGAERELTENAAPGRHGAVP